MGIWEYISSTADSVKQNAPDLTAVKPLFRSTYSYSSTAAAKVNGAVRTSAGEINRQLRDPKNLSKIAKVTGDFILDDGLKLLPGGTTLNKIYSWWNYHDKKTKNPKKFEKELEELKDKLTRLEKQLGESQKPCAQPEMRKPIVEPSTQNSPNSHQKPEEKNEDDNDVEEEDDEQGWNQVHRQNPIRLEAKMELGLSSKSDQIRGEDGGCGGGKVGGRTGQYFIPLGEGDYLVPQA